MIHLLFESARLVHPNCRLVILTDTTSKFTDAVSPGLPGPPVEPENNLVASPPSGGGSGGGPARP
eukprot:4202774-Pyramimonas_sp.AAC.1